MSGLAITLALVTALAVVAWRVAVRILERARARRAPGGSPTTAIVVDRFDAMDAEIDGRVCAACGGRLVRLGEGSARDGERLLRVVRLECADCEERGWIHFDVTGAYQ